MSKDPLTALSAAGAVVQFVNFSCKLISSSRLLYTESGLTVHGQAASATNDILDYAVKLRQPLHAPAQSATATETLTEDELLLKSIRKGCDDLACDLLARLDKLTVAQKDKKGKTIIWLTLTAAFESIWTEEDLLTIQDKLKEYQRQVDSRVIRSLR
jgi:hypothetical protein